jgi:hypothetical protein
MKKNLHAKRLKLLALFCGILFAGSLLAQSVNLTGTVQDNNGVAINGVQIALKSHSTINTTSNATGNFSIIATITGIVSLGDNETISFGPNGLVYLSINNDPVHLDFFNVSGQLINSINSEGRLSGNYQLFSTAYVPQDYNIYIVRVVIGNEVKSSKFVSVYSSARKGFVQTSSITKSNSLKSSAAAIDSLVFTKSSYKTLKLGLTSYTGNLGIIKMESLSVAPVTPGSLSATAASSTQINLSWTDNSDNETTFNIERAPGGTTTFVEIATVAAGITSYQNTGLAASTSYIYRVRAQNSVGYSGYTSTATATTPALPTSAPAAPTLLTATAFSANQINLSWTDNSNNETTFNIERAPGGTTTFVEIATVGAGVTTYQNTGLTSNTSYVYRVRAQNSAGYSAYTSTATATTQATAPLAPTVLTATAASSTQINLSWVDNSNNETSFSIERAPGGTTTFIEIAIVGAGITTYQNTGLTASTAYVYRARAYNSAGYSAYTNTATATTSAQSVTVPTAPTSLTTTAASTTQINLSWTDNSSNETSFSIERAPGGTTTFTEIATVGAGVTTYQNTGLTASTSYAYRVRAYNSAGYSGYTNTSTATTTATQAIATLRIQNNTHYPLISIKINGVEQLAYKYVLPIGNYVDYTFTSSGSVTYSILTGLMDTNGNTTDFYVFNGTVQVTVGQVYTLTCVNPTLAQVLSGFSASKVWSGYYYDANYNYHTCYYKFFSDGSFMLYDGTALISTGTATLVTWDDYATIISFKLGTTETIQMMYPFGSFMQYNGPASWKVITYTQQ